MDKTPLPDVPPGQPPKTRNWFQRNWMWFLPTGCVTILTLFVVFIGLIMMVVFGALKSSDAYKLAVQKAESDPQVVNALGSPVSEGMFLSGSTNVSGGSGNADLSIPVSGPKGKGTLYVTATKSEGAWTYSKLNVHVDGTGEVIDLLNPAP